MKTLDLDAVRDQIRVSSFPRGTLEQVALWREDLQEARANLAIEDLAPTPEDDALFAMMLEEGLSPAAMVEVIRGLYGSPDGTANS
jgi:hypothetical protein